MKLVIKMFVLAALCGAYAYAAIPLPKLSETCSSGDGNNTCFCSGHCTRGGNWCKCPPSTQ